MPTIQHVTFIAAPIEVCFDLARTVEVHSGKQLLSTQKSVGGITTGIMNNGDWVTWETKTFGITQTITSKIMRMERPYTFTDQMIQGIFHSFTHTHEFSEKEDGTIMKDTFSYKSPFGQLGKIVDWLLLERYMRSFIAKQAQNVKRFAEDCV